MTNNQKYRLLIIAYTSSKYPEAIKLAEEILANPGTLNASKLSDVKFTLRESIKINGWNKLAK